MSGPTDPFIPFVPGPANPNVPGSLTHTLLNFNFGTRIPLTDVDVSIPSLDAVTGLIKLAVVPPLPHTQISDFAAAAGAAAPVQEVAGFTGNITTSQLASVIPAAQTGTPKGLYNATTNVPTLSAAGGGGVVGDVYTVQVAGTPSFDGLGALTVGERIQCIDNGSGTKLWVAVPTSAGAGMFTQLAVGTGTYQDQSAGAWGVADGQGFVGFTVDVNGAHAAKMSTPLMGTAFAAPSGVSVGNLSMVDSSSYDFGIADANGFLIFMQQNGTAASSASGGSGTSTTSYSQGDINARNARALALSEQVSGQVDTVSARPVWNYNHIIVYGQSLSSGWEGWPRLSRTVKYDNLMLGGSVRPLSETSITWAPVSGSAFGPLEEVNQVNGSSGTIMSDSAVAALTPGDFTLGETICSGAVNFYRKLQLQARGLLADPTRLLVTTSTGVGGQTVAQLSKGASPELFNRMRTAATAVKAAATTAGGTYGVSAFIYMQGENDYVAAPETSYATYYAAVAQLRQDFLADIATTIAAQAAPPAMFTYQTNEFTYTEDDIAIGQAQLQLALDNASQGWYLVCPDYPVTDKGGHLDPNGYRWMGAQFGKVMHRVLTKGERWLPVYPTRITTRGVYVLIDFHVPEPPLVFDLPWVGNEATTLFQQQAPNQGFVVQDDSGIVPIANIALVGDAVVQITLTRAVSTNPVLKYADRTHSGGIGNLRDSDPTLADDVYQYTAGNGQYAVANIAGLLNKPYSLTNWCVAFNMPIVAG